MIPTFSWTQFTQEVLEVKDNSPYSRFGLGDVTNNNFAYLLSMGSIGASYHGTHNVNIVNPASYGHLVATVFEAGVHAEKSELKDESISFSSWNGNLDYISLGFALSNPINALLDRVEKKVNVGMSLTLAPYSTVGYDIIDTVSVENIGNVAKRYLGSGGTYKFLWGTGVKYKQFSAGINLGYLFGNIKNTRYVNFLDLNHSYDNISRSDYHVSGFVYNIGGMYDLFLNPNQIKEDPTISRKYITFGIYGNSNTSYSTNLDEIVFSAEQLIGRVDTISNNIDISGDGTLPGTLGLGFHYRQGADWAIGVNYEFTQWSNYRNDAFPEELSDSYKISMGGFYSPNAKSYINYFKRIKYKYGLFYKSDPRSLGTEKLTDYGFTLGFGLPFINQRKLSAADLSFTFGMKGNNTAIEERYMRINFGFTFNDDEWFIKRKYN